MDALDQGFARNLTPEAQEQLVLGVTWSFFGAPFGLDLGIGDGVILSIKMGCAH